MSAVTVILDRATQGEAQAAHELLPLVYAELRKLAAARMADELGTQTLQPTALVHEAWLRLVGSEQQTWKNRAHFFSAAAEAMRRILIERARRKRAHPLSPRGGAGMFRDGVLRNGADSGAGNGDGQAAPWPRYCWPL